MSLEFEIWPSAAVQRYASSAQAAARRGRTIDATDVRAVEQQARAEFPSWDASDVVSFVEHVLRTADLEVATAPSPPTAVQARRRGWDIITTWTPGANAVSYELQYRVSGAAWTGSRSVQGTRDVVRSAPRHRSRSMRVRTVGVAGVSEWVESNTISAAAVPHNSTTGRFRSSVEDADWSRPRHLLVLGSDFRAHYVVCDEDGVAEMIDVRTLRQLVATDGESELGTWRVVGEGPSESLELTFGSRVLRTDGPSCRATERETSISTSPDGVTSLRPFIALPVITDQDVPSSGAGLLRMLLTFPPQRIVGTRLFSGFQTAEYQLSDPSAAGATPVRGQWYSTVLDIFERGTRCQVNVGGREWAGSKIPESGLLVGTETYRGGSPVHVMGVTALVPRSIIEDFHGAFQLNGTVNNPPPVLGTSKPFWALAPDERDVHDEQGNPAFRIGPTAWALVIEDRGSVFVIRHEDGRIGFLHDTSGVTRG